MYSKDCVDIDFPPEFVKLAVRGRHLSQNRNHNHCLFNDCLGDRKLGILSDLCSCLRQTVCSKDCVNIDFALNM